MSKRLGGIKGCKVVTLQLGTDGCHLRGFSGGIDVDVILDTCSTIEIMICYHK